MQIFKSRFTVLIFLIVQVKGSSYAQESTRITYKVIPDYIPETFKSAEAEEIMIKASQVFSGFEFELLINNQESVFKKTGQMIEDYSDILLYKLALGFCSGDEIWYTKQNQLEKLIYKEGLNEAILLTLHEDVQWKIGEETKYIGEYKVIKANTTRKLGNYIEKIEAWFAPDLPYSFGPVGYNNLPGLIIEMKRGNIIFKLKEVEKRSVDITIPDASKHMEFKKYFEELENQMLAIKERG